MEITFLGLSDHLLIRLGKAGPGGVPDRTSRVLALVHPSSAYTRLGIKDHSNNQW